MHAVAIL